MKRKISIAVIALVLSLSINSLSVSASPKEGEVSSEKNVLIEAIKEEARTDGYKFIYKPSLIVEAYKDRLGEREILEIYNNVNEEAQASGRNYGRTLMLVMWAAFIFVVVVCLRMFKILY